MTGNLNRGDRVIYRNEECEVIEEGATYVCLKGTYTGVKYLLPTKKLKLISLNPLEIGLEVLEKKV